MISIIKKPILTEKAMSGTEDRQYQFYVDPNSNKFQIKDAVEKMFDVEVENVRTSNVKGKKTRRQTRSGLQRGHFALRKKAYVRLKEGFEIELVTGGSEEE